MKTEVSMNTFIPLMIALSFFFFSCSRGEEKPSPVSADTKGNVTMTGTASDKAPAAKKAAPVRSGAVTRQIRAGWRIIDVSAESITVKQNRSEARLVLSEKTKLYDARGDVIMRDDLWIDMIIRFKSHKEGAQRVADEIQVIRTLPSL